MNSRPGRTNRTSDWRDRSDQRVGRARTQRLAALGIALALVGAAVAYFVVTRPKPAAELTAASRAFAGDWQTMAVDDLCSKWFVPDMPEFKKRRLEKIFTRRGWLESRPEIRYVLDEMRADERKGRSEYEIVGFPPDRHLKVFWNRVGDRWCATAPTIPVLEEK